MNKRAVSTAAAQSRGTAWRTDSRPRRTRINFVTFTFIPCAVSGIAQGSFVINIRPPSSAAQSSTRVLAYASLSRDEASPTSPGASSPRPTLRDPRTSAAANAQAVLCRITATASCRRSHPPYRGRTVTAQPSQPPPQIRTCVHDWSLHDYMLIGGVATYVHRKDLRLLVHLQEVVNQPATGGEKTMSVVDNFLIFKRRRCPRPPVVRCNS